ncbi:MAG: M23 family metallopeptidase [Kofleriaceae bacterium]
MTTEPLSLVEILGLSPWRLRLRQAALAIRGDGLTPPSRVGLSSRKILQPRLALALWRGQRPYGRQVPIYNLFNHTPTPVEDGWSLRKSSVRDFRGGTLTYDSHNATDFATPPGTVVVAAAPARVVLAQSEYHRGGLKLLLDHGDGLMTTYVHLARALVAPGAVVARGQPIALSGASGLNFPAAAFCDPPHLHFGTWLDGVAVDPFAHAGAASLWRGGAPTPHRGAPEAAPPASEFDPAAVAAIIDGCRDRSLAATLAAEPDLARRAGAVIFARNYFPTRFADHGSPYAARHQRRPVLDLPFTSEDYDGVSFALAGA